MFRVTFSEPVSGVDAPDFTATFGGGLTGAISGVSALHGSAVDVTVGPLSGEGTVRLDVNAAGTGIADAAGNMLSGGFTTGQIFTRLLIGNGTWLRALSGGLWSDNANWQDGIVGSGVGQHGRVQHHRAGRRQRRAPRRAADDRQSRLRRLRSRLDRQLDRGRRRQSRQHADAGGGRRADAHRQRARRRRGRAAGGVARGHGGAHQDRTGPARPRPRQHADRSDQRERRHAAAGSGLLAQHRNAAR